MKEYTCFASEHVFCSTCRLTSSSSASRPLIVVSRTYSPNLVVRLAGVPIQRILPLMKMPTLSHRAWASSMECVVSTTAAYSLALLMVLHSSRLDAGSSPVVGSSKKTTLGLPMREIATLRRLFIPPL